MKASSGKSREYRTPVVLWFSLLTLSGSGQSCVRETHTLRYELTAMSPEDSGQPSLLILIYVDDELFLCSKGDSRKAGACGPRIKGHAGAETWTRETENLLQKKEEQLRRMLAVLTNQQGHNEGFHTLQETLGCDLQRNRSTRGFWRFGYDGQDSLVFDQKTLTWAVAVPSTQQTMMVWETHAPRDDEVKTFLEAGCPDQLQAYLASLRKFPLVTGPPEVKVTSRKYPVGRITLTCWAFNLCSRVATLTWLWDGKPEREFTCHLRHHTHDVKVPAASGRATKNLRDATNSAAVSTVSALLTVLVVVLAGAK